MIEVRSAQNPDGTWSVVASMVHEGATYDKIFCKVRSVGPEDVEYIRSRAAALFKPFGLQ